MIIGGDVPITQEVDSITLLIQIMNMFLMVQQDIELIIHRRDGFGMIQMKYFTNQDQMIKMEIHVLRGL